MAENGGKRGGLEQLRERLDEVASSLIGDALKAPTARERTQAARLVFEVLGLLAGARAQVSVQAHGSTNALTDKITLIELDVRVTGLDPAATSDVKGIVQSLGFVSQRESRKLIEGYLQGNEVEE